MKCKVETHVGSLSHEYKAIDWAAPCDKCSQDDHLQSPIFVSIYTGHMWKQGTLCEESS